MKKINIKNILRNYIDEKNNNLLKEQILPTRRPPSLTPTPTPSSTGGGGGGGGGSTLPSWADPKKNCFESYLTDLEKSGNDVVGYKNKGTPNQAKMTLKEDGSLTYDTASSAYTGYYECNSDNKLVVATCEDKEVLKWTGTGANDYTWESNPTKADAMGCSGSRISPPPSRTNWDTDCDNNDNYKKGCKDGIIKRLQRCLNNSKKSSLPELVKDGKWGKKTQKKIEELFPEFASGLSGEEIDKVCDKVKEQEIPPTPTPTPTPSPNPSYTFTRFENKKTKKANLKEDVNITITNPDPNLQENAKAFFKRAVSYNCMPKWFNYYKDRNDNSPFVYSAKEFPEPFIYGTSINNPDKKYVFFMDFTAMNLSSGAKQKWNCSELKSFETRPMKDKFIEKFGIPYDIDDSDLVEALNDVTSYIQDFINKKAVSEDIYKWYNMIHKKYANLSGIVLPKKEEGQKLRPPSDSSTLLLNYEEVPVQEDYKNWKDVKIWIPKGTSRVVAKDKFEGETKEDCIKVLKTYLGEAILYATGNRTQVMPRFNEYYYPKVLSCSRQGHFKGLILKKGDVFGSTYINTPNTPFEKFGRDFDYNDIREYLRGGNAGEKYNGKKLQSDNPYVVYLEENTKLKSKIKSTLTEIVLDKRKNIITEEVVKKRVSFLMENTTFTSRKQRRDFVINILKEAFYLESQGYDKKLIKEEFWDVVKGFFGNEGSESVFQSFKTRMAEWLTSHLSPKKADGWIGDCIRTTIKDIDMRDVHKITDCRFLTKEIAQSVREKLKEKMNNDELKDEGLYDIVRGGMADNVESARFIDHIESKVSNLICPILYDMSNKFDSTFDTMRKRALGFD